MSKAIRRRARQGAPMKTIEVELRVRNAGDVFDITIQNRTLFCITETFGTVPMGEVLIAVNTRTCMARVVEFTPLPDPTKVA